MSTVSVHESVAPPDETKGGHTPRWGPLAVGVVWMIVGLALLGFDETSVRLVAVVVGGVLLLAAISELVEVFVSPDWRWLHAGFAVLLAVGGALAFTSPLQTVGFLSLLVGLDLTISGALNAIRCVVLREALVWWGLGLGIALAELFLGLWALSYPGRSLTLLFLWLGASALLRGARHIAVAFSPRVEV